MMYFRLQQVEFRPVHRNVSRRSHVVGWRGVVEPSTWSRMTRNSESQSTNGPQTLVVRSSLSQKREDWQDLKEVGNDSKRTELYDGLCRSVTPPERMLTYSDL